MRINSIPDSFCDCCRTRIAYLLRTNTSARSEMKRIVIRVLHTWETTRARRQTPEDGVPIAYLCSPPTTDGTEGKTFGRLTVLLALEGLVSAGLVTQTLEKRKLLYRLTNDGLAVSKILRQLKNNEGREDGCSNSGS